MTRVKRGMGALKRRRNVLKQTKGFRWQRSKKERAAKEALLHAYTNSFHDRRKKKRTFRALWNIKINAGARAEGTTYSKLIDKFKKSNIGLDRKILATLAEHHLEVFRKVLAEAQK
ncbi:MAG: 50S ribosomal protein L20 [Patescibacteria group bacterium]